MTTVYEPGPPPVPPTSPLRQIERRVLWISTSIVHHANKVRPNRSGVKVGGHEASSASMATIMTSLWFDQLKGQDRVSVKPHAAPVLHAINYLLGKLDESSLMTLRQFGGLQSYPSRSKDADHADYSTGSVGIGATAAVWGALSRRYLNGRFDEGSQLGRQYSLVGDAELDEGAVWEALIDPHIAHLGEIVWIVDMNRQSLDRVIPSTSSSRLEKLFDAVGWQVITVRFGHLLNSILSRPAGKNLRRRILDMPNAEYQRLLRCDAGELRLRLPGEGTRSGDIRDLLNSIDDATLVSAIRDLGGHDLDALHDAYTKIDDTRPTVILAYTIKGYGLPVAGHPQNHSALLSTDDYTRLAEELGEDPTHPWSRFPANSQAGRVVEAAARRLQRDKAPFVTLPPAPHDLGKTPHGTTSTQAALGRTLLTIAHAAPDLAQRIVTVSPDVGSSTNLAGWINKVGVWAHEDHPDWFSDDDETLLHWREGPHGQHVELGIAETNLVGLLGELGATWSRWGRPLIPVGTLYDPFVERALEPWSFGIYAGGQSILIGTPSGVTLASEGGAHQSIKTPSIGLEQPNCLSYEPAFALDLEWSLLAVMRQIGRPGGKSAYVRLSTRPIDQELARVPVDVKARAQRREQVVAGGYMLRQATTPDVTIVAMGAVTPEAIAAAEELAGRFGYDADVICLTSPGLVFEAVRARQACTAPAAPSVLDALFPEKRARPMVTVLDGHPHTLTFLATINNVPIRSLGVTVFGQSGDIPDVYRYHGIGADSIVDACLGVLEHQ